MVPSSTKLYHFDMTCYRLVHHVTMEYKIVPLRCDMLLISTTGYHRIKIVPRVVDMVQASTLRYHRVQSCTTSI